MKLLSDLDCPTDILNPECFKKMWLRNFIDIHKKINGNGIKLAIIDVYNSESSQKDYSKIHKNWAL